MTLVGGYAELPIASGVGRGYLNNPDATEKRFVMRDGVRWYRCEVRVRVRAGIGAELGLGLVSVRSSNPNPNGIRVEF